MQPRRGPTGGWGQMLECRPTAESRDVFRGMRCIAVNMMAAPNHGCVGGFRAIGGAAASAAWAVVVEKSPNTLDNALVRPRYCCGTALCILGTSRQGAGCMQMAAASPIEHAGVRSVEPRARVAGRVRHDPRGVMIWS